MFTLVKAICNVVNMNVDECSIYHIYIYIIYQYSIGICKYN